MQQPSPLRLFLVVFMIMMVKAGMAQNPVNWTKDQLMEPAELSQVIQKGKKVPVIFSVGPGALIPHSIDAGMASHQENLDRLKKELGSVPKKSKVVIYCGCCPFEHCPNVRPAISLLKEMGFTNYRLLDLPHNLKTDWIDKGYPVVNQ
jgi:thiosulfate/3-mercaptopyruvate sulfurtransferase